MLHDAVKDVGLELLLLSSGRALRGGLHRKPTGAAHTCGTASREPAARSAPVLTHVRTSSSRSTIGVCLLAGVVQRLSMIRTLMKSNTYFLAGWLVSDVLEPTLQYSDWLRFMPESPAKALNSSVGDPASSSKSLTWWWSRVWENFMKLMTRIQTGDAFRTRAALKLLFFSLYSLRQTAGL